jgi:hypothetical protein
LSNCNEPYYDRNQLVQLCAQLAGLLGMTVGIGTDEDEPDWPVVFIDLPTGQVSYHIPMEELVLQIQEYPNLWDGHTNTQKRDRIRKYINNKLR